MKNEKASWADIGDDLYQSVDAFRYKTLPPGFWVCTFMGSVLLFKRENIKSQDVIHLPDMPTDKILAEIDSFWGQVDVFQKYNIPHKRGILLHGAPGTGKTSIVRAVAQQVIDGGGLVFKYDSSFPEGYNALRKIEPDRNLVVVLEDIDRYVKHDEEALLEALEGRQPMEHVVFIATTNYLSRLPARIRNRPSRFDRVFEIGYPSQADRLAYLKTLVQEGDSFDVQEGARLSAGLSIAHVKELFVSVQVLGNNLRSTVKNIKEMGSLVSSEEGGSYL